MNSLFVFRRILSLYRKRYKTCSISLSSSSSSEIYSRMKELLDSKEHKKIVDIFNEQYDLCGNSEINLVLKACTYSNDYKRGINIHEKFSQNSLNNPYLQTKLIQFYMQSHDTNNAYRLFSIINDKSNYIYATMFKGLISNNMAEKVFDLFDEMKIQPNKITLTVLFSACARVANDRAMKIGRKLLNQIYKDCEKDNHIQNSAINMLMRFGDIKNAENLFQMMNQKDIVTYSTMIKGYNINNEPLKSLKIFEEMKKNNINVDVTVLIIVIGVCAQLGMRSICQSIVDQIPSDFYNNPHILSSLIHMWGKVGSVKNAEQIFESINKPDAITYSAMINAFGLNRMGLEAINLYRKMPKNLLDEIIFICVLNACSHSALLDQAYSIFNEISHKTTKIIATMVDCLSRLFLFDEAQKLIEDYEKSNPPSSIMYTAILSGARNSHNLILSEKIYKRMKLLFPNEKDTLISGSILLCNIYSSLGDHKEAEKIRLNRIKEIGKKVQAGLAWTEVNGEIAQFKAHDHSHPRSNDIHAEAERISFELIKHGHNHDSSWITRPLNENETIESVLCTHSERLAIAFNFIDERKPSFIQITKNLRVCGDCHEATKLIAKIRQCEIIVRDANCIHHFSPNGTCSCQDHF